MMNSIEELYPLLRFLKVDRYNDWKTFAMDIAKVSRCVYFQPVSVFIPM